MCAKYLFSFFCFCSVGDNAAPKRKFLVVVMKNACISTMNAIDASTQTPVHAETQTDKSAVSDLSNIYMQSCQPQDMQLSEIHHKN